MPSDPTPTEAEMRQAAEWCNGELASSGERPYPINAYAAALAKCRVERETCVGHCQHCKTTIQNKDGCVVDSRGMFHPICAATLAERERCAKIADSFAPRDSTVWGFQSGFVTARSMIAAAIRGGGE